MQSWPKRIAARKNGADDPPGRGRGAPRRHAISTCGGRSVQAVQILGCALRVGRGGEDRPAVRSQDLQPDGEVLGVVRSGFEGDSQVGAQERGAQLRDELLGGVRFIPEALSELAGQPARVRCPMGCFVEEGRVKRRSVAERLERRELNEVSRGRVVGSRASVSDGGTGRRHEPLDASDSRLGVNWLRAASCVVVVGETLDLFDVEDGIALEEVQLSLGVRVFVASVFVDRDGPRIHDE